jgi:MFS family permease
MLAVGVPLGVGLGAAGPLINRIGPKKALLAGAVVLVAGDLLMALMREPAGVVVGFAVGGLAMGLVSAPPNMLMYRYVPVERRGAAVGVLAMLGSSGAITAPALVTAFLHFGHGDAATIFRAEFLCAFLLAAACPVLIAMLPTPPEAQPHAPANDGGRN